MAAGPTATAPTATEPAAPQRELIVFPVVGEWHALPLTVVREVVARSGDPTPMPAAPDWMAGLVNLRGAVVPVLDSARALALAGERAPTHLVVADTELGPVAVAADAAPDRRTVGDRAGAGAEGTLGCHFAGDVVVTLLDVDHLTRDHRKADHRTRPREMPRRAVRR